MPTHDLATVRSYHDLVAVLRSRADELMISRETIDAASRLPKGYSAKLLSETPIKGIGQASLDALLTVLRLDLVVRARCSPQAAFDAIAPDVRKRRVEAQVRRGSRKR